MELVVSTGVCPLRRRKCRAFRNSINADEKGETVFIIIRADTSLNDVSARAL
jgi:hypothetical protein